MRENNESVTMRLEICEATEEFKFDYIGSLQRVVTHLISAIIIVLKRARINTLPKEEKQKFIQSLTDTMLNALNE